MNSHRKKIQENENEFNIEIKKIYINIYKIYSFY